MNESFASDVGYGEFSRCVIMGDLWGPGPRGHYLESSRPFAGGVLDTPEKFDGWLIDRGRSNWDRPWFDLSAEDIARAMERLRTRSFAPWASLPGVLSPGVRRAMEEANR